MTVLYAESEEELKSLLKKVKEEGEKALAYSFLNLEPISCSIQGSNSCFLSYIQVSQETGKMVCITVSLSVFHSLLYSLYDPANFGNLISFSSAFSKPSLDIWKFLVCIILKPSIQDFKHDLTSMGDECNCLMVRIFFSTTLLGN